MPIINPSSGVKPHRRIDTSAISNRGEGTTIPQMTGHKPERLQIFVQAVARHGVHNTCD